VNALIVYNPISGAGRAAAAGERLAHELRLAGHAALAVPTKLDPLRTWLDPQLQGVETLIVVGGDGAMRLAAPAAIRTGVPVYHLPLGTENLFAREFGMDRSARTLMRAMDAPRIRTIDTAVANGRVFLLMASIGFDAEVVHDLASRRGNSISHLSYVGPIVRQLRTWKPPELSIHVDGREIVARKQGFVVVGNSRQYGWRTDPAGRAMMDDGLLDLMFFPTTSRLGLCAWAVRCRTRRQWKRKDLVHVTGSSISVQSDHPFRFQMDGDPPGVVHELESPDAAGQHEVPTRILNMAIKPATLRVLTTGQS
jgi:diacylglycerol kinase (ATP)